MKPHTIDRITVDGKDYECCKCVWRCCNWPACEEKTTETLESEAKERRKETMKTVKMYLIFAGVLALLFLSGLGGCATNNPDRANLDFSPLIYTGAPTVRLAP